MYMTKAIKGAYPHLEWLDLYGDGIAYECAIMKRDENGNVSFIKLANLDDIDKSRLRDIVTHRNAKGHALWDLMSQVTLGNGVNALEYFHQLVKILTPSGKILDPVMGRMGLSVGQQKIEKATS